MLTAKPIALGFGRGSLNNSTLKKRFLLFDRLPAALAPHTRASGRSRGPDTTQKPHRSRKKVVSWPSAALESQDGRGELPPPPPECEKYIHATLAEVKNDFY